MRKSHILQIAFLLLGFLLTFYFFNLPKFIVSEETKEALNTTSTTTSSHSTQKLNTERIEKLTSFFINEGDLKKRAIFADSIAQMYREAMLFDSSAKYFEVAATLNPVAELNERAALGVFEAFQNSTTEESRKTLGKKAIGLLDKVLENNAQNVDAQIKKSVCLVYTEPMPMAGISSLKEIINANPKNIEARLYLGEFQFTVGKIDAAIEQFSIVHQLDPMDFKALLYLVEGYLSLSKKDKAEEYIQKIKQLESTDPYIQSVLKQFDEELKKL